MEWTNELTLQFLDYYETEPIIWDASHVQHKNRNEIYEAWKRIQIRMPVHCSITELKKKKDSLMASFRTLCNKVKNSEKTVSGGEDVYKPHWFAFAKMDCFLRGQNKNKSVTNTMVSPGQSCSKDGDNSSHKYSEDYLRSFEDKHNYDIRHNERFPPYIDRTVNYAGRKRASDVAAIEDCISKLQKIAKQYNEDDDEFDLFGKSVALQLKKMPLDRALICQEKLQEVIKKERLQQCGGSHHENQEQWSRSSSERSFTLPVSSASYVCANNDFQQEYEHIDVNQDIKQET